MTDLLVFEPIDDTREETGPIRVTRFPCIIGRSRECETRLNLHRISRRHLRLALDEEKVIVEDLGSTNGTFVNDERLSDPAELRPGDRLHIADYAFQVQSLEQLGRESSRRGGAPQTLAGQTIAGFTEDPDGFPVQAPQLYELLNDALLEPTAVAATLEDNPQEALLVGGRSTHPALNAGHERLVRMARQIGEEARYHGILREVAMVVADEAGLDHPLIVLPIDALEVEDAGVLLHELGELAGRFRRLRLACRVDASELDLATLQQLGSSLDELGIRLAIRCDTPEEALVCRETGITALRVADVARPRPLGDYS
ncbi:MULTISPECIES: FHA domain-containing protein [unclassified Wenzhouxiangella]|uniref:FHA domain-containing protein n=1 Tax=unclassified Wenzhouxiangella TaxID=2613841 RepID=UPI000E326F59|nr:MULTISPECIES: FHA domain-containing protein [unclassified Wenzhouxiangella]RFF28300.1 FHA domain-containing protein [Wenzhouxiangella sp. 15181]RFP67775.1 FHA domain-containing protein [Wenzhouxiangella sp. 15190]